MACRVGKVIYCVRGVCESQDLNPSTGLDVDSLTEREEHMYIMVCHMANYKLHNMLVLIEDK